jgi:glutaredoxin 3
MSKITIYTRPFCGYCSAAVSLLRAKGVAFNEIEAGFDPQMRREMIARSGRHTFPQIFVGDSHLGDCDEMMELERQGRLDALLAA